MVATMATEKDFKFIEFIYSQTKLGKLQWEGTADPMKFVTSFKGKYKATIDLGVRDNQPYHWLTLLDDSDRELLRIDEFEISSVVPLFDLAQRNSLNIDSVIDEIMGKDSGDSASPISDDDIPF